MGKKKEHTPFVALAEQYARDVISGKIVACEFVRQACQRHFDDKEKSRNKDYPYTFDPEKGERICKFASNIVHIKGIWIRKKIVLEPWQCFVLAIPFGWLKKEDGLRRFRQWYLEIPRKNAKSTLAAIVGLFMLVKDDEGGAEVYSGATSEKQAWEVFGPAKKMAAWSPGFKEYFGVKVDATNKSDNMAVLATGSKFEPMVGKPGDGASPSCAIIDEYHEHKDEDQLDTMQTGMGSRSQPILLVITTGGSNQAGPCYALRKDLIDVLNGTIEDEQFFGIIWTLDKDDDWSDFSLWPKANPNYGVSIFKDYLKKQHRDAINNPRRQNILLCKHLNLWVNARTAWLNMNAWRECGDADLTIDSVKHLSCIEGLDLASSIDIAARVKVFFQDILVVDGESEDDKKAKYKRHYYVFGQYYLPEDVLDEPTSRHYQGWRNQSFLTLTDGNETDFGWIEQDILTDAAKYQTNELAYDRYQAVSTAQRLTAQGMNCVEFPQQVATMSPAMKEVEAAIKGGRLHHDCNPVLSWMMSNVVAHVDAKENIYPRKEREENKIDGAVALIMAVGRAMLHEHRESVYEDRGFIEL